MDEKRQQRTQNVVNPATGSPTVAVGARPRAAKPSGADRPPRLGEILVAQGHISRDQHATALDRQQTSGRRLGEEMIKAGYVKRTIVSRALRMQRQITAITDADVLRGYVEVPTGSRLRISSNNPAGYFIDFFTRLPIFRSVRVSNSNGSADLGPDGGTIIERGQHGRNLPLDLSYRFMLASNATPGTYAWPLALNVRPL